MTSAPDTARFGDFQAVRTAMAADTRSVLLHAAATMLSEAGPSALTIRRLADAVNASTKVIYTYFGGKDGLFEALYLHSFAGLTRIFEDQDGEPDPLIRLQKMAMAYREFAIREPALYNVMFGDLGRAWQAPVESRRRAWQSFEVLRDTIGLCLPLARSAQATRISYALWAGMHGVVSLELRGLLGKADNGEQVYRFTVMSICAANGLEITVQER